MFRTILILCSALLCQCVVARLGFNESFLISRGASTEQSSTAWDGFSRFAVDGNRGGYYFRDRCSHSASERNNWWTVTFDNEYPIDIVYIYNREDCCQYRIDGAQVYAGNQFCGKVTFDPLEREYRIACGGAVASNVTIRNNGNYLTLCEVEVYSKPAKPCSQQAFETSSSSLSEFKDCTTFRGDLVITNRTLARFRQKMVMENTEIIYDLTYLRNIKKITGALVVNGVNAELKSLSFLQNLRSVENKDNQSVAIQITNNSGLKSSDLHSLKSVDVGAIKIANNPKLCYFPTKEGLQMLRKNNFSETDDVVSENCVGNMFRTKKSKCPMSCGKFGCWGKHKRFCVQNVCQNSATTSPTNSVPSNKPTSSKTNPPPTTMPSPTPEPVSDCENKPISFGCWKDSPLRAISGGIRFIPGDDPIEGCRKIALDRGYKVFAVQYGGECFTDEDAHQTYQKYGRSEDCSSDGRGGPWAQNVYQTDCSEDRSNKFEIVDEEGIAVLYGRTGLLLYNGGTVCDDYFNEKTADIICRQMGYRGIASWFSGRNYNIQNNLDITLDDISCNGNTWDSCTFETTSNCGHSEDVFISCKSEDPTSQITEDWRDPTESVSSKDPQSTITKVYTRTTTKSKNEPSVTQTIFSAKTEASTPASSQTSKTQSTSDPTESSMESTESRQTVTTLPTAAKTSSQSTRKASTDIPITYAETTSASEPTVQTETIRPDAETTPSKSTKEASTTSAMASRLSTKDTNGYAISTTTLILPEEKDRLTSKTEYLPITDVLTVKEETFNELGKDRFTAMASLLNTKDTNGYAISTTTLILPEEKDRLTSKTEYLPMTDVLTVEEETFNELGKDDRFTEMASRLNTKDTNGYAKLTTTPILPEEKDRLTSPTEYAPITDVLIVEEETFNELGKDDMMSKQKNDRDDRFMDNLSLKSSLTNTEEVQQSDSDRTTYDYQMSGDVELANSPAKFVLSAEEFRIYEAAGYFNGVKYSWNLRDGSYVVTLEPDSYKRFYDNKDMITESETLDEEGDDTTVLTLTETEFNEYMAGGYFRGIKYRWTSQGGTYTVKIAKSSYDKMKQNMESGSSENQESIDLAEEEFMSYVVSGYFDGLAYEWSDENRVYTVLMSQKDYQQFLRNKEAAGGDAWASQTKMLFLTEEEFNEYKTGGYFRGIKYRWTSQGGTYTVYISKSSYDRLRQNMESEPAENEESITLTESDYKGYIALGYFNDINYAWSMDNGFYTVFMSAKDYKQFLRNKESTNDDVTTSETKVLTLTEEEFNEYKTGGYFRGIKYRWTSQGGTYTVYISKSSYDKLRQNMETSEREELSLTLSEENFNQYETRGYFEGVEYKWMFQSGTYTLLLSPEDHEQVMRNIKSYEEAESQGTKQVVRKSDGMMFVVTQTKRITPGAKNVVIMGGIYSTLPSLTPLKPGNVALVRVDGGRVNENIELDVTTSPAPSTLVLKIKISTVTEDMEGEYEARYTHETDDEIQIYSKRINVSF
ncbi:hypothetical protein ACHWQZ_G002293 [Mnemiopsis leidyi]